VAHPLDGVRAKLARATDHLNAFNAYAAAWLDESPYVFASKRYDNPPRFVFRIASIKPPDPQMGVIAGDLFHELRSAFDHVVWQLVEQNGGTPGDHLQFPIFRGSPGNFYKATRDLLRDVPLPARRHIKRMQPYVRGNGDKIQTHPLTVVRAINNEDKHRVVLEAVAGIEYSGTDIELPRNADVGEVDILLHWGGILRPGRRVATVRFEQLGPNPQMELQGRFNSDVAIGEIRLRLLNLPGLCGEIMRLLGSFKPFFPAQDWPLTELPPHTLAP
jgi:hypothetical protein